MCQITLAGFEIRFSPKLKSWGLHHISWCPKPGPGIWILWLDQKKSLCKFYAIFFLIHLQSLHVFKIKIFSNVLFELRQQSLDQCLTHIYFTPYTNKHCTLISHCSGFWSSWCSPHFAATIEVQLWLKVKLCSSLTQLLISVKVLKDSWVGDAKTEE